MILKQLLIFTNYSIFDASTLKITSVCTGYYEQVVKRDFLLCSYSKERTTNLTLVFKEPGVGGSGWYSVLLIPSIKAGEHFKSV